MSSQNLPQRSEGPEKISLNLSAAWKQAGLRIDRFAARLLLEHVCGCTHAELLARPEREITSEQSERLEALVSRRAAGEPMAYLLGAAWFAGFEFAVTPDVLIPRPETEVLVDLAVERAKRLNAPGIVDLGTGSGIIAVMLAKRCPNAAVTAVDVSPAALAVASFNAVRHAATVRFLEGDWYEPLGDMRFDLIVSNPPYVADADPHLQQDGLPYEPQVALTDGLAGGDGMACLQRIIQGAEDHLQSGGWLLMEHGYDQAVKVRQLLSATGFSDVCSWRDEAGIERVSGGCWA